MWPHLNVELITLVDGKVNRTDVLTCFEKMFGKEDIAAMHADYLFTTGDVNRDGLISFEEYIDVNLRVYVRLDQA